MKDATIETREDADAFVLGLTLLSTGGGGLAHRGREYMHALLDEGFTVQWVPIDQLDDSARSCSVFGMGSVAPRDPMTSAEQEAFGVHGETVPRPGVRAVEELGQLLGDSIDAIVPFELGGFNTIVSVDAATRLGLPLLDSDFMGRALPEMSQALPAILGLPVWPLAVADQWGSCLLMVDCPSPRVAERIGKMISTVTKSPNMLATCAHAAFPLTIGEVAEASIKGTLTRSFAVGRAVFRARQLGISPVDALVESFGAHLLFRGRVRDRSWEDDSGYMTGTTSVEGSGEYQGMQAEVWFKNENHLVTVDGVPRAMSPDTISIIRGSDGEPLTNTELAMAENISVIGFACDSRFRSGPALEATAPRHYGIDIDYRPIESVAS